MSIQDELPRSRVNLKYRTNIDGIEQNLELPFRLLIMGDFSAGSSVDRTQDLETRRMRGLDGKNLDSVMENMKMSLSFQDKPGAGFATKRRIKPLHKSQNNRRIGIRSM